MNETRKFLVTAMQLATGVKLVDKPEPCMRCNRRHYHERERRQCAVEALHAAMRYVVKAHYNRRGVVMSIAGTIAEFAWDSEADHETALLLEHLWRVARQDNAMQMR